MKNITLACACLLSLCCIPGSVFGATKKVKCPSAIVDRQTRKYSTSKAKYVCYGSKSAASKAGYEKHSFSDDSSSCSASPTATPSGTQGGGSSSGDYNLAGPGERESAVFVAPSGGTVSYTFTGGGQFEIKVLNANTGKKIAQILEITQAGSDTLTLAAYSSPISIKVEGPGVWTVSIDVN